jgi:methylated-DNA-[protein]-cysteine S-methyltransferase
MPHLTSALHDTPIGDVLLVSADARLLALRVLHDDLDAVTERFARTLGALPEPDDAPADAVRRQLDEYFDGERRAFDLDLDWGLVHGFAREALQAVCTIPYGETAGYGEVAMLTHSPRAARAVGTACAATPFSIVVPVHRVVRSDGSIGEYGGHPEIKRFLLDLESGR